MLDGSRLLFWVNVVERHEEEGSTLLGVGGGIVPRKCLI